jgi:hypothetical protein
LLTHIDETPFKSIKEFVDFWGFRDANETLTMPALEDDRFLIYGNNFKQDKKDHAQNNSLYFCSPYHLYALYCILTSPTHGHLLAFYMDAIYRLYRAGRYGACIIEFSTVDVDLHCSNSNITASHLPLPKVLTIQENGASTFTLLRLTCKYVWVFTGQNLACRMFMSDLHRGLRLGARLAFPGVHLSLHTIRRKLAGRGAKDSLKCWLMPNRQYK